MMDGSNNDYIYDRSADRAKEAHPYDLDVVVEFIDPNTGEWVRFPYTDLPSTDEEAEMILPRPPVYSDVALIAYRAARDSGATIKDALMAGWMASLR